MPRASSAGSKSKTKNAKEEIQVAKSPAEFFAENQAIAGFDNMGKSLYTTLRELVENSLDACESVNVLPDIAVFVEELTMEQFNKERGAVFVEELTMEQFNKERGVSVGGSSAGKRSSGAGAGDNDGDNDGSSAAASKGKKGKGKGKGGGSSAAEGYFRIKVRDNGCGMAHDAIPNLLGRVLSGSKYGVRQTRGKFGLGAKMALIWSKKSTGVPIRVTTSHNTSRSDAARPYGPHVSRCVLDIDIYKNRPRVLEHTKRTNSDCWVGTEFEVLIGGNWTTYKSRIVQYLLQLAIITPYASLELHYKNLADPKKDMSIRYGRRSEQMPPPAREVKHHPSSVNNLLVQQLLDRSKSKTIVKFLTTDLSAVGPSVAKRLVQELEEDGFYDDMSPSDVSDRQITRLVQLLRMSSAFKAPDGTCLSPLGEYNLSLGIRKVVEPDVVATARDKPGAYEGHPFIVEAAVSIGGKSAREGITVYRFANRIPLLFEGGSDVATRVANNKIKWSSYKIDHKRDRIGVFVSIVSTKVPFKGTGKEYIGDDITELQLSVKRALQSCCQQLRSHLTKRNAIRDQKERKNRLNKYVPDISRSLFGILDSMRKRKLAQADGTALLASPRKQKRTRLIGTEVDRTLVGYADELLEKVDREEISEESIGQYLIDAVDAQCDADDGKGGASEHGSGTGKGGDKGGGNGRRLGEISQPLFLVPIYGVSNDVPAIHHPLFTFRPTKTPERWPLEAD
eukprot:CAMPEP_0178651402 /NCGR_PEP_ID=MMETSP0698-20121128/22089_1 /TAXON_ID=265572 /ORGANISM="Extubocellulus spinifer, Strain CCMP396" /LENGTH=734 /DNA_ID=CAMNT_0020293023 /DNA_START=70 /DNA_END=2274 /DNA_ORIENTATION=-